jgi:hypothetical protein
VATNPSFKDRAGTALTRIGLIRNNYRVSPGLYGVGTPNPDSPILVTANYKLSFDAVRFSLDSIDAWLLVVDTRGINVWCAAGKRTFSTEEVIFSVKRTKLKEITSQRTLILPQFSATGVSAMDVKNGCGFKVLFGPIQARDLPDFLQNNNTVSEAMRSVTFTTRERIILIPVELYLLLRPLAVLVIAAFLLSGIGPEIFSYLASYQRGLSLISATLLGIFSGSVLLPILLPWLYGRQFWIKGLWPGLIVGLLFYIITADQLAVLDRVALFLWIMALSSYQGMNFTGCTPYTSPSGVEYEMRRGIPIQALVTVIGFVLWMSSPFIG